MTWKNPFRWESWRAAAFLALLALLIALFDPMGLDSAADRRSAEVVDRVLAIFYGGEHPVGRDKITTIFIDDDSLSRVGREWPPQYGFYAQVLRNLVVKGQEPAVVFLDYSFLSELYDPDQRNDLVKAVGDITHLGDKPRDPSCLRNPVAKIVCIKRAGGVPVVIGKPYPVDQCEATKTLVMLDRVAVLAPLGWPGMPEFWKPLIPKRAYAHEAKPCPAVDGLLDGQGNALAPLMLNGIEHRYAGVSEYDLTPAAAMFTGLCLTLGDQKIPRCRTMTSPTGFAAPREWERSEDAKVLWGSRPDPVWREEEFQIHEREVGQDPTPNDLARISCAKEGRGGFRRLAEVGLGEMFSHRDPTKAGVEAGCAYHATFRYERFAPEAPSGLDPKVGELREHYIKGRAVIVGSALSFGGDWIFTVTNGLTPGMALHGMMLDNLIELKALRHNPGPVFPGSGVDLDWGEVLELALTFFAVLVISELAHAWKGRRPLRRGLYLILSILFGLLVFFLLALLTIAVFHWTPVNIQAFWAIILLGTLGEFTDVLKHFSTEVWRFVHRLIAPRPRQDDASGNEAATPLGDGS